jgi:hypothetical protein
LADFVQKFGNFFACGAKTHECCRSRQDEHLETKNGLIRRLEAEIWANNGVENWGMG